MKFNRRWFAGFVMVAALAGSACSAAGAEIKYWNSGQTFTVQPKMNFVPNTDVYYQRRAPGYDLYRHANRWYLVQGGDWYVASTWRGPFASVDVATLPEGLTEIPADYRKHWGDEDYKSWTSQRTFTRKPRMTSIATDGVSYAREQADFDLYRRGSTWYLVENGVWFRSDSWKGPFVSIRTRDVPKAVRSIPPAYRRHWVPAVR